MFGLFTLFFNLGGRSLENKDSVDHPEIAREILELNDWIMLHENGNIYVDKPPLHHWITALSFKVLGVNTFAARFPEAVAAFCGILLAFFFSKSIFQNSETAFLTAIILLSTFGYLWWARRTRADIEFSIFFAASLISFYCGCEAGDSKKNVLVYGLLVGDRLCFYGKSIHRLCQLCYCHSIYGDYQPQTRAPQGYAGTASHINSLLRLDHITLDFIALATS